MTRSNSDLALGTSVIDVLGNAGFDDTNLSMTGGFVSALNPVLTAQITGNAAVVTVVYRILTQ